MPRPEPNLNEIAANIQPGEEGIWVSRTQSAIFYPESGNDVYFEIEDRSFWFQHRNRCIIEAVNRFPPGGPVFDIGGGNGFVSLALQNAGWPVVLVEPGFRGAAHALHRGVGKIICSTLEDAGFTEGCMAAAGAFDVVEHMPDDLGFVRSIGRSLAPNGRFYLTVPAFPGLWSQEDVNAGHCRRYTAAALRRLLVLGGLEVEYMTYFFRFLPLPILLMRTAPYRVGMRRSQAEMAPRTFAEHKAPAGVFGSVFDGLLNRERALIRAGRSMAFGGSCLCVARKI
jgi:SAM-dependent methyltransferase